MLENAPQRPGVGECRGNLVGQIAFGVQTEVRCPLTRQFASQELVENVRPQQATFDAD